MPDIAERLRVGMMVSDVNGFPVGEVLDVRRESFRVAVDGLDHWVSSGAVFNVGRSVHLLCNAESVSRYFL